MDGLKEEPYTELQAWIFLICEASHTDHEKHINNEKFKLKRGELIASTRYLAKKFGWHHSRLRRYLTKLEDLEMIKRHTPIDHQTAHQPTHITICKYDEYQTQGHTDRHTDRHTPLTQNTINGLRTKNGITKNGKQSSCPKLKYSNDDMALAKFLDSQMKENLVRYKPATEHTLESWANDFRLMRERDKIPLNEIREVLKWATEDEFWKNNIRSGHKFRKQYTQLINKMRQPELNKSKDSGFDLEIAQRNTPKN